MKKFLTVLMAVVFVTVSSNFAFAKDKNKEVKETQEESTINYFTPIEVLVAEYYKTVAQIKQKENEIDSLQDRITRLDAIIQYQQEIERKAAEGKKK